MEAGQAFEPRRGSTLLEQPPDFAGISPKVHDAIALKKEVDGTAKKTMGR